MVQFWGFSFFKKNGSIAPAFASESDAHSCLFIKSLNLEALQSRITQCGYMNQPSKESTSTM
jgi:hypothetical protein